MTSLQTFSWTILSTLLVIDIHTVRRLYFSVYAIVNKTLNFHHRLRDFLNHIEVKNRMQNLKQGRLLTADGLSYPSVSSYRCTGLSMTCFLSFCTCRSPLLRLIFISLSPLWSYVLGQVFNERSLGISWCLPRDSSTSCVIYKWM